MTPAKKATNFYCSPACSSGDMLRSEITRESLETIDTIVAAANNVDGSVFLSADVFPIMQQAFSAALEEVNISLPSLGSAPSSSTASNVTILATLNCKTFNSHQGVRGHLVTDVNFLSPVFSSDFLDVGYGKLREIIHFHGGLIFSKRTKVILVANVTGDSNSQCIDHEVRSIFEYLKSVENKFLTKMPEDLLF